MTSAILENNLLIKQAQKLVTEVYSNNNSILMKEYLGLSQGKLPMATKRSKWQLIICYKPLKGLLHRISGQK